MKILVPAFLLSKQDIKMHVGNQAKSYTLGIPVR